jgi:hypothetical protein
MNNKYEIAWNMLKKCLLKRHSTYSGKLPDDRGIYKSVTKAIETTLLQMADIEVKINEKR